MEKKITQTTTKKIKVLIVDDSKLWAERLVSILNENDITGNILHAGTCAEGMNLLDKKPDLVFLDISLPDKSGIILLQHIKERFPEMTVCMTTNMPSPVYRIACKTIGADEYFDKTNEFYRIPFFLTDFKKNTTKNDTSN
jgi:DNA-binding response OmpR family regulator